jgi:chaperonin cofactor prefoldin
MASIPCFLCGQELHSRIDKNHKPYFICDPCGLQSFIRRKTGIERLAALASAFSAQQRRIDAHNLILFEMRGILSEMDGVKEEIAKLNGEIGIFFPDQDKLSALKALKQRLANLLDQLNAISKQN